MITTQIQIKPHLAEYVKSIYRKENSQAVAFPPNEDLYITVSDLMQKLPEGVDPVVGNLEIVLPVRSSGKCPTYFNYLSRKAQEILETKIENRFWAHLHEFVDEKVHIDGDEIRHAVYMFITRHEIESITSDALSKNYYRWRFNTKRKRKTRRYEFK